MNFKNRFRFAVSLLLVLCLTPVATKTRDPVGLEDPGMVQRRVLFAPDLKASAASVVAAGRRAQFPAVDGPFKKALTMGQRPYPPVNPSSPFVLSFDARVVHRADRAATPIRAPPRPI